MARHGPDGNGRTGSKPQPERKVPRAPPECGGSERARRGRLTKPPRQRQLGESPGDAAAAASAEARQEAAEPETGRPLSAKPSLKGRTLRSPARQARAGRLEKPPPRRSGRESGCGSFGGSSESFPMGSPGSRHAANRAGPRALPGSPGGAGAKASTACPNRPRAGAAPARRQADGLGTVGAGGNASPHDCFWGCAKRPPVRSEPSRGPLPSESEGF